jgi:arylsulfatase A-like enzyme
VFLMMSWFGLVAGLVELGVVVAQRVLIARISLDSLRTNQHFAWMIPTANLLIFSLCGLVFALVGKRRPGLALALACLAGTGLLALSGLLAIEGLHTIARVVVTCAIASQAAPWLRVCSLRFFRWVRWTLPAMAGGLVVAFGFTAYSVSSAERRAWDRLPAGSPTSPNVLFIVMDDVRADSLSLYGYARPTTPRLAELARNGFRFDAARSPSSWTLPSHASMFTGQWSHRLSVHFDRGLDATYPTLAEFLANHGYATAGFVANTYYCNAHYGLDRGFGRYEDFHENQTVSLFEIVRSASLGKCLLRLMGYSMSFAPGEKGSRKTAAMINRDALEWLSRRPDPRPFFLFLNYYDAHAPFIPPEEATQRFGLCALPQAEQVEILKRAEQANQARKPAGEADRAQLQQQALAIRQDGYESCIAYLDDQIGRLYDELRLRGLLENTLVIVTSDHGEHFQEHGFSGHGLSLYRREIHVPLLIFPPGVVPERHVVSQPVSLRELPATVADLLGLADSSPFPGRSLARFFRPGTETLDDLIGPVLSELEQQSSMSPNPGVPATLSSLKALTMEKDVYIRHGNGREELFDRVADPFETKSLVSEEKCSPTLERSRELLEQVLREQNR